MATIRTALIGCGKVGQIHAAALTSLPESQFVGVCDAGAERAAAFASRFNVPAFTGVETMLLHLSLAPQTPTDSLASVLREIIARSLPRARCNAKCASSAHL
jgi:NAD-dependent oxidoreductase involved in siderophore biosynthesis